MRFNIDDIDNMTEYELKKVVLLDMSFMNLTEIPINIFRMSNLEYLNISNNSIVEISKKIIKLVNLKTLYIKNNPITCIHENIIKMQYLNEIYLDSWCVIESIQKWSNSIFLFPDSNPNNLSENVEHLIIDDCRYELINLPNNLKSLNFVNLSVGNLKVPINCRIFNWL